jgi:polyisoprenoid-binding protein YceI
MNKVILFLGIIALLALAACSSAPGTPVPTSNDAEPSVAEVSIGVDNNQVVANDNEQQEPLVLPADTTLVVNPDESVLAWAAEKIVGASHEGELSITSGELVREEGAFVSGNFVIDMTSMTADGDKVLGHLKSEDFFDVETYPESRFVMTSMQENEDGTYEVTGDLTILDATNEITFTAVPTVGGSDIIMESTFTIDRTRWGIVYGSGSVFDDLGDSAIRDTIEYDLTLVLA